MQAPGGRYVFSFRDADYNRSAVSLTKSQPNFSRPIHRRTNANRLVPDAHASPDRLPLAHHRPFDSVASRRNTPRRSRFRSFASVVRLVPAPLESPTRDQSELPLRFSVAGSARTNASLGELAEEGRGLAPRYSRHLARQMNCCTDPGRLLRRVSGLRGDRLPWYHRQQYVRRVALVMENGLRRCLPAAARGLVLTSVQVAVEAWEIAGRNLQAHAMPR